MSKDMAKSLVAAALMVAFSTPVAANTATGSRSESGAFSKQADGIVMPTDAGGSDIVDGMQGAIGIESLEGKTEAEIKSAAVTSDTNLSDADPDKVFFLYNVKTGKFLNAGGYWGTHVSLKDYPLSLWVKTNPYKLKTGYFSTTTQTLIDFIQNLETGQGQYLGWKGTAGGTGTDDGVFIDRHQNEPTHYGWVFESQNDGKHTYKIYTYATNSPTSSTEKYYLCANKGDIDQDKNCGAFSESSISGSLAEYSTWRVLSMKQISDLLKANSDYMTSALDLSYRLDCPGFSRGNKDITKWKVSNFSTGTKGGWRFGLEKLHNTHKTLTGSGESTDLDKFDVTDLSSSYIFDGREYKNQKEDYERHLGKYFCTDVKNMRGVIYQDVEIKAPGSYLIECKGYSTTTKAKIFASWFDKDGKNEDKSLMHQNVLNQVSYMSKAEQEELHVSEQNMDYAGKNFYGKRKYINTVLVQVSDTKIQEDGSYGTIRFGLIIGDNQDDTNVNVADKEWTVFDDFRLLYASNDKGTDLILDEDRDNLDYLENCSNNTYKNTVLHLNKTFTKDKWNSFVLPVSLKRDQFRQAFGANARLAKLSNLTSSEIQFQTVNMDAITDNSPVLDAYTPYIIFPTKIHTDNTKVSPAYVANLSTTNGESNDYKVVVKANHYDIPNVTFETTSANKNDLSQMDTKTWVSNVTTEVANSNGTMKAYGTFARTFGSEATQDKDGVYHFNNNYDILEGRDNLIGCYFFDKGNLYRSDSRPRGLRGFSCWFKPVNGSSGIGTKVNLYIDGVANGTTGIDEVAFGDEEPTGKAAKGIYNMNGQLVSNGSDTTNLPAGMYIVNGKKCVVR